MKQTDRLEKKHHIISASRSAHVPSGLTHLKHMMQLLRSEWFFFIAIDANIGYSLNMTLYIRFRTNGQLMDMIGFFNWLHCFGWTPNPSEVHNTVELHLYSGDQSTNHFMTQWIIKGYINSKKAHLFLSFSSDWKPIAFCHQIAPFPGSKQMCAILVLLSI